MSVIVGTNPLVSRRFSQAHCLASNGASYFYERGVIRYEKAEYDNAFSDIEEAIRLNPQLACAYHIRGKLWQVWHMYGKARTDFSEAIRLDSNNAIYYYDRATK